MKTESPRRSRWLKAAPLLWLAVAGCRQDMHDQPRYEAQEHSVFFEDQRASRPVPEGTVARGFLRQDAKFYQGKEGEQMVKEFPLPVTADLLARGRERYNVYCSPCHGQTGDGKGMIPSRGGKQPPSYHLDRLREAPVGYFYDVIINGFGAMYDYSAQIQDPKDRWAIVAYIRVLQRSRYAPDTDAPAEELKRLGPPPAKPVVPTAATPGAAQ